MLVLTALLLGACDQYGSYYRGRDQANYEARLPPRSNPDLRARVARRDTLEMQRYVRLSRARAQHPAANQAYMDSIDCEYGRIHALYPERVTMRPHFLLSLFYPATPDEVEAERALVVRYGNLVNWREGSPSTDAHCKEMLRTAWGDSMPVAPDTTLDPPVPVAPGRP